MENNNEKSKSNDSKEIAIPSDRSSSAKESGKNSDTPDDLTSIFSSELKSELSETDKLSIVESLSSDDEIVKLTGKLQPVKVKGKSSNEFSAPTQKEKQPRQKKQPKVTKLISQFESEKTLSSQTEAIDDKRKYILGDYTEGKSTGVSLPDSNSQKLKTTATKLEAKPTVNKSDEEKTEETDPNYEKAPTFSAIAAKFNSLQSSKGTDSKSAAKPKISSPAPFVHSQQHKKVPPPNSAKAGFERAKAVAPKTKSARSKKATLGSSHKRTASPHSPASIREKCACKLLAPGKVNHPIGEAEGSRIWARPNLIPNLEYDPILQVEILKSKVPFASKKVTPKAPKKSPFPDVAHKLQPATPKGNTKDFKPS